MSIEIITMSGVKLNLGINDFEIVQSKSISIAKGKCFLIIFKSLHCYEISRNEFMRLAGFLFPNDVDAWESARSKV